MEIEKGKGNRNGNRNRNEMNLEMIGMKMDFEIWNSILKKGLN